MILEISKQNIQALPRKLQRYEFNIKRERQKKNTRMNREHYFLNHKANLLL